MTTGSGTTPEGDRSTIDDAGNGGVFGGPTASSWREQSLTRVAELENLAAAFEDSTRVREVLVRRIGRHLQTAREAADGKHLKRHRWTRMKALVGGSALERTASNLDAA